MDSSLLFLAIVGLVVCYLVPRWLRNRHDASQSPADDRFSRAMRMITPRESKPASGSRGLLLRDGLLDVPSSPNCSSPNPTSSETTSNTDPVELPVLQANSCRPSRRSRQLGVAFLLTLIASPVLALMAAIGLVPWTVVAVDAAVALGCGVVLRMRVRHHQRRVSTPVAEPTLVTMTTTQTTTASVQPSTMLYDGDAIRTVERAAALAAARADAADKARVRAELEANLKPGEWLPVEVPKPAYLLKPSAPRRPVAPDLIDLDESPDATRAWDEVVAAAGAAAQDVAADHSWLDQHAPLRRAVGS